MSSTALKVIGGVIAGIGAWAAIVAYAGPAFGYPMPPGSDQSAWEWSASHTWRHLLPGVAAIAGGALLWARTRGAHLGGAGLALLAGAWMILSPFVVRAWLDGGGGGGGGDASLTMQIITPLGYHHVPGILVVGLSSFVLGTLLMRRVAEPVAPAARRPEEGVSAERQGEPARM